MPDLPIDDIFASSQPQQSEPKKQLIADLMVIDARDTEESLTTQQAVIQALVKKIAQSDDLEEVERLITLHHNINDLTLSRVSDRKIMLYSKIKTIMDA